MRCATEALDQSAIAFEETAVFLSAIFKRSSKKGKSMLICGISAVTERIWRGRLAPTQRQLCIGISRDAATSSFSSLSRPGVSKKKWGDRDEF
jgi:hypothetical protein